MTSAPVQPTQNKRGPKTPEGKARSRMNAVRHGLRARTFALLPEECPAEWALHLADLRRCYGPVDEAEEKLVAAIAAAMWNEIRADRTLVETMARIPHGADLGEPAHARAMGTALRYMSAAGMATQRAQRAFLAHRKAKQQGLLLPAEATKSLVAAAENTNDLTAAPPTPDDTENCTNENLLHRHELARRPAPAAEAASLPEPAAAPAPLNRHQRRRRAALAREAQRRAA